LKRRDPQAAEAWKMLEAKAPGISKLVTAKSMSHPDDYWPKRREFLRQQALQIKRMRAETAGQLVLPIFGDPDAARKLADLRDQGVASITKGLHVADQPRRA